MEGLRHAIRFRNEQGEFFLPVGRCGEPRIRAKSLHFFMSRRNRIRRRLGD